MSPRSTALQAGAVATAVALVAVPILLVHGAHSRTTPRAAALPPLSPNGVAVDGLGNVYVADYATSTVQKISPSGGTSIVAGISGQPGVPTPGPATSSRLSGPSGLAVDSSNNLYICDFGANALVEKVTPTGTLSIVAGVPGAKGPVMEGPATSSNLMAPAAVTTDGAGNLYLADALGSVIDKISSSGNLSVVAGQSTVVGPPRQVVSSTPPYDPVPGAYLPALQSDLYNPSGVAVDASGNVYIADTGNSVIEQVTPAGALSIIAGFPDQAGAPQPGPANQSSLGHPIGLALSGSTLFVADATNNVVEQINLTTNALSVVAGSGTSGTPTPGAATSSALNGPAEIAVDSGGNLYIADSGNNLVEKVTPAGILSVIGGNGAPSVAVVSPGNGPTAGGTTVTVGGSGFTGATAVNFGTAAGTNVTVTSPTTLTVTAPAGIGTVDVTVTTPSGTSAVNSSDKYTFGTPPQRTLTVTASNATVPYGSSPPTITPAYSGFASGDTASVVTTPPTCTTTATATSAPGTYPSTCTGAAATGYGFTYVGGTVTVTPAAITVTAKPVSIVRSLVARRLDLVATVTSKVTNAPVAGLTVGYTVVNPWGRTVYTCSAVTNAQGVATCSTVPTLFLLLRLPVAYTTTVASSTNYSGGTAGARFGP